MYKGACGLALQGKSLKKTTELICEACAGTSNKRR
jgi:hypothetical protein